MIYMKKIIKKLIPIKLKDSLRQSFYWYGIFPKRKITIINQFHALYYDDGLRFGRNTWRNTFWFGVPLKKCPLDLWIYQELLYKIKPDVVVECGTAYGG
ncbi:MAG: cephalosporin hydroxylase cmci, partial [Parcubacteria group bacterium Gr01-1014_33]